MKKTYIVKKPSEITREYIKLIMSTTSTSSNKLAEISHKISTLEHSSVNDLNAFNELRACVRTEILNYRDFIIENTDHAVCALSSTSASGGDSTLHQPTDVLPNNTSGEQ